MVTKECSVTITTIKEAIARISQIRSNGFNSKLLPCGVPDPVGNTPICRFVKPGLGCGHPDRLIFDPESRIIECPLQKGRLRVVPTDINEK